MAQLDTSITVSVDDTLNTSTGMNNLNYLQPTSFKLNIDHSKFANTQFFCQTILHPGLTMNSIEVPFKRISSVPFAGDKLTFSELTVIIIVDENLNSYTELYNWMDRLVDNKEVRALDRTDTIPPTYADITVSILSSHNNTTRQIRYLECIPVSLGDMTLESTSGDVQYITFPATFRFTRFQLI